MAEEWTQLLVIPLPKKGNVKQCQNYCTISLISHPSKIMLRVILNRLKAKAEELLAEEVGFRPLRSTVDQILNNRVIIEKHQQHQHDLFHNDTDFKRAFDKVWNASLWQVLRSVNIVQAIQALYESSSRAVLSNS